MINMYDINNGYFPPHILYRSYGLSNLFRKISENVYAN